MGRVSEAIAPARCQRVRCEVLEMASRAAVDILTKLRFAERAIREREALAAMLANMSVWERWAYDRWAEGIEDL